MPNQANITPTPDQGQKLDTETCFAAHEALVAYCQEWLKKPDSDNGMCAGFYTYLAKHHFNKRVSYTDYMRKLFYHYYLDSNFPFNQHEKHFSHEQDNSTLHLNPRRVKFITAIASRKFKPLLPKH